MNLSDASSKKAMSTTPLHPADTRLHGRWLVLVQLLCLTLGVLSIGLFVVAILSWQLTPGDVRRLHELGLSRDFYGTYTIVLVSISALGYWLVAALLFWRKSDDRVALLAAVSLATFPIMFNDGLINRLPSPWWFLAHSISFLGFLSLSFFFCVFPSGHFVPRWTRWGVVVALMYWGFDAFFPSSSFNPFYPSQVLGRLILIGLIACSVIMQIYRYRWVSSPAQRQQTKWVVFGVSLGWGGYLVPLTISLFFPSLFQTGSLGDLIKLAAAYGLVLLTPLSLGIAILRSRLWEIDILINRTLVYGTLTAMLALVYVGLVIALQFLLRGLIGQTSAIAIVASTLAIYALFHPLRKRIQQVIDRRFYRRKYDAARTLAAFSATLREEVDLDQLREALLAVVQETMQPAHVSLWLRPTAPDRQQMDR